MHEISYNIHIYTQLMQKIKKKVSQKIQSISYLINLYITISQQVGFALPFSFPSSDNKKKKVFTPHNLRSFPNDHTLLAFSSFFTRFVPLLAFNHTFLSIIFYFFPMTHQGKSAYSLSVHLDTVCLHQ